MHISETTQKRGLSPTMLNILVAAFIMAAYNNTFWGKAYRIFDGNMLEIAMFGLAVFGLILFVIALFSFRWLQKPFLIFLLLVGGVSSYYMDTLGVMIDRDMIQNVVTTTVQEGKHLITLGFVGHVLLYAIIPAVIVWLIPVKQPRLGRGLMAQAALALGGIGLCAALLFANYRTFSGAIHDNKDLMGSFQPGAPITSTIRYANLVLNTRDIVLQPRGEDAVKGPLITAAQKPVLTVIMVGETARAQDFSLLGYERDTNPELEAMRGDITVFEDVRSCGTATATSLPCMFSRFGRSQYSYEAGLANENLLDILTHAGVKVEWFDNNTGDKGIADRIGGFTSLTYQKDPEFCSVGECNDGILLKTLKEKAATITEDTVLVLHQIGSHGPSYYLRYPKEYERFTPTCKEAELKKCSNEAITNTYDNTIAYTDHILAESIKFLQAQDNVIPAMFYMSDHGESLGENGIYLHGTPYFMAPDFQTRVPMILWFSDAYKKALKLDSVCLDSRAKQPATHENMFHTILGMMNIETGERNPDLDVVSACRTGAE